MLGSKSIAFDHFMLRDNKIITAFSNYVVCYIKIPIYISQIFFVHKSSNYGQGYSTLGLIRQHIVGLLVVVNSEDFPRFFSKSGPPRVGNRHKHYNLMT